MKYQCKNCSTLIPANTNKKLIFCKCGKIGIDSCGYYARVIGDTNLLNHVDDSEPTVVYRIKNLENDLYYKPSSYRSQSNFSKTGKFYTRKPKLDWVNKSYRSDCVIEKYEINLI
jgi:hypothetical protein